MHRWGWSWLLAVFLLGSGCQQVDEVEAVRAAGAALENPPVVAAVAGPEMPRLQLVSDSAIQESAVRPHTAAEALSVLLAGNQRFVAGQSNHPHESADYRASLAQEQHPFATVLACSDSRVTPVLIFDQGIGDLFVIRVAGNVVDPDVAGSIEYAVDHLGTRLLLVLGHENCGAVTAAFHAFVAHDLQAPEPAEIMGLLRHIQPALQNLDSRQRVRAQIAAGVEANVRESVQQLLQISDLKRAHDAGLLKIMGAIYSVRTGKVRVLQD